MCMDARRSRTRLAAALSVAALAVLSSSCGSDSAGGGPNVPARFVTNLTVMTVTAGETEQVTLKAYDMDGDDIRFRISKNPGFLSLGDVSQVGDTATVILTIAPNATMEGAHEAEFTVTDGKAISNVDSDACIINVEAAQPEPTTTKLFLRSNSGAGADFLSTQQEPSTTVQRWVYWNPPVEWRATLDGGIAAGEYEFAFWLGADPPSGVFDVSLLVSDGSTETTLASKSFTVPNDDVYRRFSARVQGQSGGSAGDQLILRIAFSGSTRGGILYGPGPNADSHVAVPGEITVGLPGNLRPRATIDLPADGGSYAQGETITFSGFGDDPEDGPLSGGDLVWESNLDGQIGTGESFTRSDLSAGSHIITLTATDSEGATDTDSVGIVVEQGGGSLAGGWQASTEFGGFVITVNPEGTHITEITHNIQDWACGSTTWSGNGTAVDDPGWSIDAGGAFTIQSTLNPNLSMTISGTFDTSEYASGSWSVDSYGTVCTGSWAGGPATRLYLHYDGSTAFLSSEPPVPGDSYWLISYTDGGTFEWVGDLNQDLSGSTYTFWLWLLADSAGTTGGAFDATLLIDDGVSETELAATTFDMQPDTAASRQVATTTGASGGTAGDALILRVTYSGGEPSQLNFDHEYFDSQVIVPGRVTVSGPSPAASRPLAGARIDRRIDRTSRRPGVYSSIVKKK